MSSPIARDHRMREQLAAALQDNVRQLEMNEQLRWDNEQLRRENTQWSASYSDLETTYRKDAAVSAKKIADLDTMTTDLLESKSAWLESSTNKRESLACKERQLATQDQALAHLHGKLQQATEEVTELREERTVLRKSVASAEKQLLAQKAAFQDMRRAVEKAEIRVHRQQENFAHGQKLRMDLKHLQIDNSRLVRLLSNTKEYRQFCAYHVDSGHLDSHYISATRAWRHHVDENADISPKSTAGAPAAEWSDLEALRRLYPDDADAIDAKHEALQWVSQANVQAAAAFRREFMPHVSATIIDGFLRRLNADWKMRCDKQVKHVRDTLTAEITELRRTLAQRAPYGEVVREERIVQLKKELRKTRNKVGVEAAGKRGRGKRGSRAGAKGDGVGGRGTRKAQQGFMNEAFLESTMATVEVLSKQNKDYERQTLHLQQQLAAAIDGVPLDSYSGNVSVDPHQKLPPPGHMQGLEAWSEMGVAGGEAMTPQVRAKFVEGAAWFGQNAMHNTDSLGAEVEAIAQRYKALLATLPRSSPDYPQRVEEGSFSMLHDVERKVSQARAQVRGYYEATLEVGSDGAKFRDLDARMPVPAIPGNHATPPRPPPFLSMSAASPYSPPLSVSPAARARAATLAGAGAGVAAVGGAGAGAGLGGGFFGGIPHNHPHSLSMSAGGVTGGGLGPGMSASHSQSHSMGHAMENPLSNPLGLPGGVSWTSTVPSTSLRAAHLSAMGEEIGAGAGADEASLPHDHHSPGAWSRSSARYE